jgi:hypothetical protein
MIAVDEETGEPITDPPNEKSDVNPDFVEKMQKPSSRRTARKNARKK